MKDEEEKKVNQTPQNEEQKKQVRKLTPKEQQEQDELLFKADSISPANKKANTKEVELNNGDVIDLDKYILENYVTTKSTHFYLESFYYPIADLMGINRKEMENFVKPVIVPYIKKYLIYSQFPNRVQERLYQKNKYVGYYKRVCWNYQWLSVDADKKLRDFIDNFEREIKIALAAKQEPKQFIKDYCIKFKIPYQTELFDQI